jgi:NAD(P)-dependent dehydrogenase (short-subunit alcohol dehydrogenase family)
VVISSIGGLRGSSVLGAYTITKAADIQLVRNYAVENGKHGIRVNGIAPGLVKTDFAKALYENPAAEKAATERTPMGRLGVPDDIAGAAVFLASPAASWLTGQTLVVDGGSTV